MISSFYFANKSQTDNNYFHQKPHN